MRKAVLAGTDRVCRTLSGTGLDPASLTLGEVPPGPDVERLRARRRELGLPAEDGDPLLLDPATGQAVAPGRRETAPGVRAAHAYQHGGQFGRVPRHAARAVLADFG